MYTGLLLVICIVRRHFLFDTKSCFPAVVGSVNVACSIPGAGCRSLHWLKSLSKILYNIYLSFRIIIDIFPKIKNQKLLD